MISRIPSIPLLSRVPRRLAAVLTVLTLAVGVPFGVALASHNFSDVPTTHLFHHDIEVLVNTGVTAGCGGGRYCPEDPVTRGQMAAFMSRLGALDGQPPKVNALTAQNASALDGLDSSAFARPMWAVVNTDGSLARGAGVVSSSAVGTGSYQVLFNRDVTQCAYTATLGNPGSGNPARGFIITAARIGQVTGVYVETRTIADVLENRSFHLQVSCVAGTGQVTIGGTQDAPSGDGAN